MREFLEDSLSGFASYFHSNLLGGSLHLLVGRPQGVLQVRRRPAVDGSGLLGDGLDRSEENGDGDNDDENELSTESEKITFL